MRLLAAASLFLSLTTATVVPEIDDLGKRQGNGSTPVSVILLEERSFSVNLVSYQEPAFLANMLLRTTPVQSRVSPFPRLNSS